MRDAGLDVRFATPEGLPAYADARLVEIGFGPLNPLLMTRDADLASYARMTEDDSFRRPLAYADVDLEQFAGLLIPAGSDRSLAAAIPPPRSHEEIAAAISRL